MIVPTMAIVTFVPSQTSTAKGGRKFHWPLHSTIKSSAQVMFGGVVSLIVMTWTQLAKLVQESPTVWVRKMTPPQGPPMSGPSTQP